MLKKKLLLLLILIFLSIKAFPAVFIVTSNADSGPGTLRDALTQAAANGTTEKDFITFNIPDTSQAGRKINLITELPDLTSNLVIDGSGQPGSIYGLSGAHIELNTPLTFDEFTLFNGSGLNDVEFYGLYMHDYTNAGVSDPDQQPRTGVTISNSSNIIFGAPGKGNLFFGFNTITISLSNVNYPTFQGNVIGLSGNNTLFEPDNLYLGTPGVSLYACNNILIGGDAANAGNVVFSAFNIQLPQNSNDNITVKWNTFGVYQDGKKIDFAFQDVSYLFISTIGITDYQPSDDVLANGAKVNADIENNLAGVIGDGAFVITAVNGEVDFYNNFLGISRDGTVNLNQDSHADEGTPIVLSNCRAAINIGSNDPTKGNFLAYSNSTTSASNCPYVMVRNNEYECIGFTDGYGDPIIIYGNDNLKGTLPTVSIDAVNENNGQSVLTGIATPGAVVDIFGSESCTYSNCSIRKLIETVTADANGAWKSNLINTNGIFYVSATKNNITSTFQTFNINIDKVVATNIRCTGPGTITGIQLPTGLTGHWLDSQGNIVSSDPELVTNTPGDYRFVVGDGCISSYFFHILDNRVVIYDSFMTVTDPGCGKNDGAIDGLFAYDPLNLIGSETWTDSNGKVVSTTAGKADNLAAGSYTYTLKTTDGCVNTFGPVVLKNTTGPNIDQSKALIQSTNCGQSTGSITNIIATGSGTLKYIWWNDQQNTVSTTADLINQPAGTYQLEVTDDSQCGAVYTTDLIIPETNAITLNETGAQVTISSCSQHNGSITGITVTGATQYQWVDANNKVVGTSLNLLNVGAGNYTLTASNNSGCSVTSKTYTVGQQAATTFPNYPSTIYQACLGKSNGGVEVPVDTLVKLERWVNNAGQTVGTGIGISNMPAGVYQLYLTDNNGCESYYASYTVTSIPQLYITPGSGNVTNDECSLKKGGITGIAVNGGRPPYNYIWLDANGNTISRSIDISGLAAGDYTFEVNDNTTCGLVSAVYTIQNQTISIPVPVINNFQVCSPGTALLRVDNPSAGYSYRLYSSQTSTTALDEQASGVFTVTVNQPESFYISQVNGGCESSRTQVQVTVGISSVNIANTFTPNGDGINDYWTINGIGDYTSALVQVFTRYGQKVFESKGYATPFDGTYKGQKLPAGVYYYIINLNTNCNLLSGSLTIIR